MAGPSPALTVEPDPPQPAPARYLRLIRITVADLYGRPLPGVRAEIESQWGRLVTGGELVSNPQGQITFHFEPVVEDLMAGLSVRDRYLVYKSVFQYRLTTDGRTPQSGIIEDEQEYAGLADPLYSPLSRQPSSEPLEIRVTMPRYVDFLAGAPSEALNRLLPPKRLSALIDRLQNRGVDFSPTPGSIGLDPDGTFRLGLEFRPLFDPSRYGLQAAGAALLVGPAARALKIIRPFLPEPGPVRGFRFTVAAKFQYRAEPFSLPLEQDFTIDLTLEAARRLAARAAGQPLPLEGVRVAAGNNPLDLSAELSPQEVGARPGNLLKQKNQDTEKDNASTPENPQP